MSKERILKTIYRAASAEMAEQALASIPSTRWWHASSDSFFEFPEEIRKIIYTTNAVESLHMTLRKVTKTDLSGAPECIEEMAHGPGLAEALRQRWPDRIDQSRA